MMQEKFGLFMVFAISAYAEELVSVESRDNFWIWIAMFSLGVIGILILFVSSRQMSKIHKIHENVMNKQIEMEKNQALILTSMSENIHSMAKEALQKSTEAIDKVNKSIEVQASAPVNVENALLDVTNDLIDFLRLKSRKVEIINEEFNLNNVLNEISGTICSHFKGSNVEFIFDIDKEVPRFLVGDSLHLGQILNNILENRLSMLTNEELKLEISMFNTINNKVELQLQLIDNGTGMTEDEVDTLFIPRYDEESCQYSGLGLFVAQELVSMMNGRLSIHSNVGKGTSFTLTLPFDLVEPGNKRKYRLPDKVLTDKKVFIVDSNHNSALALKKMFAYFKHDVKVLSQEKFLQTMPKLTSYDIIVLNDNLFSIRTVNYLKEIKAQKELKVVSLSALLKDNTQDDLNDIIDKKMFKPLNQERIFEMITTLYQLKVAPAYAVDDHSVKAQIYKSTILETNNINQSSFNRFAEKKLLIVEDNVINQKVLVNILNLSGMDITVASNGAEAVELIKKFRNKEQFDLVLMDINMPVMDGYTATKVIRSDSQFDALPVVAFTALVLESEIEKMFNSGINAFLAKPLNIGKLYTALEMFLLDTSKSTKEPEVKAVKKQYTLLGLDVEQGIKHSNNSQVLYSEILKEFAEAYGKSDEVFATLVKEHRFEQLKMLCLDMRGLSGTIGAKDMHLKIDEIQKLLLYNKYGNLPEYVDVYQKELKKLMKSITLYLQE